MCDICGDRYALKSSLGKHRKTKHPEEAMMADALKSKKTKPSPDLALNAPVNYPPQPQVTSQVKGKVLVCQQADGSIVVSSKPGDRVDLTQQGAVLVLPQAASDNSTRPAEGTVVVMQSSLDDPQHPVEPNVNVHNKRVIRRQSSLDLCNKKIKRQSPLDLGECEVKPEITLETPPVEVPANLPVSLYNKK